MGTQIPDRLIDNKAIQGFPLFLNCALIMVGINDGHYPRYFTNIKGNLFFRL